MKLLKLNIYIFLFLLFLVILINLFVNPYGFYGKNQLKVHSFSLNLYKLNHQKKKRVKDQAIIFGSSNTLSMNPEIVQNKTGLKTYNYGVFQFTVEDFYCSVRALNENKALPKLIILCIDDWALADKQSPKDEVFKGAQNRLAYKPELAKYLPDYSSLKLNWCRFKSSISYEQFHISFPEFYNRLKSLDFKPLSEEEVMAFFYENGTRKKFTNAENCDITDSAESGKYDVGSYLRNRHESLKKFPNKPRGLVMEGQEIFNKFSEERIKLLESTIEFLHSHNCKLIITIMPLQPYYQELIRENTNYNDRIKQLISLCTIYKNKYPNILFFQDNHEIANFNGKSNYFFDENHLTTANSNLILESLFKKLPPDAF